MYLFLLVMFVTRLEELGENALMGEEEMALVEELIFIELFHISIVVEDNLFIVIDEEEMLRELGDGVVVVNKSVAEELAQMETKIFSFALLDVNLGPENSLPVLDRCEKATSPAFSVPATAMVSLCPTRERRADRLEAVQQSIVHRCFAAVAFYLGARRIDG